MKTETKHTQWPTFAEYFECECDPRTDVWFQFTPLGDGGEFACECNGRRFVSFGEFDPDDCDAFSVDHGPTQRDVDVVSALLDAGVRPHVVGEWKNP